LKEHIAKNVESGSDVSPESREKFIQAAEDQSPGLSLSNPKPGPSLKYWAGLQGL